MGKWQSIDRPFSTKAFAQLMALSERRQSLTELGTVGFSFHSVLWMPSLSLEFGYSFFQFLELTQRRWASKMSPELLESLDYLTVSPLSEYFPSINFCTQLGKLSHSKLLPFFPPGPTCVFSLKLRKDFFSNVQQILPTQVNNMVGRS